MDIVSKFKSLLGIGRDGSTQQLRPSHGIPWSPPNGAFIEMRDGSSGKPIQLPELQRTNGVGSELPLFVNVDGTLVRLSPPQDADGKWQLIYAGGVVSWRKIIDGTLRYNANEVATGTACGTQYIAVLEGCDDSGILQLKKVALNTLFNECGAGATVDYLDFLVGCQNGLRKNMAAAQGFTLGAVLQSDGSYKWGPVAIKPDNAAVGVKSFFRYTGSMQTISVPTGATKMFVKCWGASGGSNDRSGAPAGVGFGGGGGYTYGEITVSAGQTFGVLVGQAGVGISRQVGDCTTVNAGPAVFGFGGVASVQACSYFTPAGGGMSALVTGTTAMTKTDRARVLLCAGGGGGGFRSGSNWKNGQGGNAENPSTTDMQGASAGISAAGRASGGGGYYGGPAGIYASAINGGTGFAAITVENSVKTAASGKTPANNEDVDYQDQLGHGLIVISFAG